LTLGRLVDSVTLRPRERKSALSRQAPTPRRSPRGPRYGECQSFGSLKTEEKTNASAGNGRRPSGHRDVVCQFRWPIPIGHQQRTNPGHTGESSEAGPKSPGRQEHGTHQRADSARVPALSFKSFRSSALGWVVEPVLDGEFDPGSGRTLAACLTHASRTGSKQSQDCGRSSGERVRNT
jgi:hypothetical protein